MAMAVGHLLQALANRTALRRERERLFDFARDPFLAPNQQHEPSAHISYRRDLPRERAGRHRRRAAALAHQPLQRDDVVALVFARIEQQFL
jgi:hypothetical protein